MASRTSSFPTQSGFANLSDGQSWTREDLSGSRARVATYPILAGVGNVGQVDDFIIYSPKPDFVTVLNTAVDDDAHNTSTFVNNADQLSILIVIATRTGSVTPTKPTVTQTGVTWDEITDQIIAPAAASRYRLTVFRCMPVATQTTAVAVIDFGGVVQQGCHASLAQYRNVATGSNGANAVRNPITSNVADTNATSIVIPALTAFSQAVNTPLIFTMHTNDDVNPDTASAGTGYVAATGSLVNNSFFYMATSPALTASCGYATPGSSGGWTINWTTSAKRAYFVCEIVSISSSADSWVDKGSQIHVAGTQTRPFAEVKVRIPTWNAQAPSSGQHMGVFARKHASNETFLYCYLKKQSSTSTRGQLIIAQCVAGTHTVLASLSGTINLDSGNMCVAMRVQEGSNGNCFIMAKQWFTVDAEPAWPQSDYSTTGATVTGSSSSPHAMWIAFSDSSSSPTVNSDLRSPANTVSGKMGIITIPFIYSNGNQMSTNWPNTVSFDDYYDNSSGLERAISAAAETDSAHVIDRYSSIQRAIGTAASDEAASSLTMSKRRDIGTASEDDATFSITRSKRITIGVAAEDDAAIAISRVKRLTIGTAAEVDSGVRILSGNAAIPDDPNAWHFEYREQTRFEYRERTSLEFREPTSIRYQETA